VVSGWRLLRRRLILRTLWKHKNSQVNASFVVALPVPRLAGRLVLMKQLR
jgi:hypothetical protein